MSDEISSQMSQLNLSHSNTSESNISDLNISEQVFLFWNRVWSIDELREAFKEFQAHWVSTGLCLRLKEFFEDRLGYDRIPQFTKIVVLGIGNFLVDNFVQDAERRSFEATSQLAMVMYLRHILGTNGTVLPALIDNRGFHNRGYSSLERSLLQEHYWFEIIDGTDEILSRVDQDTLIIQIEFWDLSLVCSGEGDNPQYEEIGSVFNTHNMYCGFGSVDNVLGYDFGSFVYAFQLRIRKRDHNDIEDDPMEVEPGQPLQWSSWGV